MKTENHSRRHYLSMSRAMLNMCLDAAIKNKNVPLAEALQDVLTFKRDRNREARKRFGA